MATTLDYESDLDKKINNCVAQAGEAARGSLYYNKLIVNSFSLRSKSKAFSRHDIFSMWSGET